MKKLSSIERKIGYIIILSVVVFFIIQTKASEEPISTDDREENEVVTERIINYALLLDSGDDFVKVLENGVEVSYDYADEYSGEEKLQVEQIIDLKLHNEKVVSMECYTEKISGKLLRVTADEIELEQSGIYKKADHIVVYEIYGATAQRDESALRIGSEWIDFIVEDGCVIGAIVAGEDNMTQIRVLLKTTDYINTVHSNGMIVSDLEYTMMYEQNGQWIEEVMEAEEVAVLDEIYQNTQCNRIIFKTNVNTGKLQITSIERSSGIPYYRGTIEALKVEDGWVIINEVTLEEYLYSVVPSEMPSSYPMEALKAQAICARTYACRYLLQAGYPEYGAHVDDSVGFQVYNNIEEQERTNTAVKETIGQIVWNQGELAETYYYSTSCGISNDVSAFSDIEPSLFPYLTAKMIASTQTEQFPLSEEAFQNIMKDSSELFFEQEEPFFRWLYHETEIDSVELTERISQRYNANGNLILTKNEDGTFTKQPIEALGVILDIVIEKRSAGGCVEELIIVGTNNTIKVITQYNIRYVLKMPETIVMLQDASERNTGSLLPSAFFLLEVSKEEEEVVSYSLAGGGYGHGVGLSQNGAKAMAEEGYSCEQILTFFYEGTTIGGTTKE